MATLLVYSLLFGTGYVLYGETLAAGVSFALAATATGALIRLWPKLGME